MQYLSTIAAAAGVEIPVATLIVAIGALVAAIGTLWRYYSNRLEKKDVESAKREDAHAAERERVAKERAEERAAWEIERGEIRAEMAEHQVKVLTDSRAHEDLIRREHAETIDMLFEKMNASATQQALVLDKLLDRVAGGPKNPRPGTGRYG